MKHTNRTWAISVFTSFAALACSGEPGIGVEPIDVEYGINEQAVTIPTKGGATTLDIGSWNIEWFGDTGNGPSNESLQLSNAKDVIAGADLDIWGLAEIVSLTQFNSLKSQLPGYAGFMARESTVVNGSAYYGSSEQNVAILYKSSLGTVTDARVILTGNDYEFGGRPPMQVKLNVTLNGRTEEIVVIVMHAKCCSDAASWTRRNNGSIALKSYLDSTFPTQRVWVLGDYNDDIDTSITPGQPSPYVNFVSDAARYVLPSKALTDAGIASTTDYPDTIDHHLNTNEANAQFIAGSIEAYRVDSYITDYANTTSDHYPVLSRYTWQAATPVVTLTAPNGGESWAGGSVQNLAWTSSGVSTVFLDYSTNNGGSWNIITNSTSAVSGLFAWTVPSVTSSQALVRVGDTASSALDQSNAVFSLTGGSPADVIVNEICANEPGSDTNGEFIELVNRGGTSASIAGWTLSDASSVRHTFASGTNLLAGKAIVVFGASSGIPGGLTNAIASSTGALSLANGGDTVTLKNAGGTVVKTFTYSSSLASTDGVSINLSPDGGTSSTFVKHNTLSSLDRSAGTRTSGAAW